VDAAAIPAVVKAALREQHDGLSKRVLAEQKAAAAALADAGKAAVLAAAGAAAGGGAPFFVARVDQIAADGKAAQAVMEAVKKAHPALSFLAFSVGVAAGAGGAEEPKVLAFAQVAEVHRPAKSAKDWIAAVMAAGDGKGGGRDDTAQGTTKDPSKIAAMEAAAAAYFSK
jgi:alanyl-tRNA synthetase